MRTSTGGKYVGQSSNVGKRLSQHAKSGKVTKSQARTALGLSVFEAGRHSGKCASKLRSTGVAGSESSITR
ncbi:MULTISPECIES: GIY-YIG nuclease family protein [Aeromicrobium]|uniref:GIY-YIG nuclease family protein n=1 Tax=Aeromicrobium TaxID=2040 RepID=UPI0035E40E54